MRRCAAVRSPDVIAVDGPSHQMVGIDGLQDVVDLRHRGDVRLVVAAIVADICSIGADVRVILTPPCIFCMDNQ